MTSARAFSSWLASAMCLAGCASQPPVVDISCDAPGARVIASTDIEPTVAGASVPFALPEGDGYCVRLRRLDSDSRGDSRDSALPSTEVAVKEVRVTLGKPPEHAALSGGGAQTETTVSTRAWRIGEINFWGPADGTFESLVINSPGIPVGVDILGNPPGPPPIGGASAMEDFTFPEIECLGRLRGFRQMHDYGNYPARYPALAREAVGVACSATYVVFASETRSQRITITSNFTLTDSGGRFLVKIPESVRRVLKSDDPPVLQKIEARCIVEEACGFETITFPAQTDILTPVPQAGRRFTVDIGQVLNIASKGSAVTATDGVFGPRFMLGARLISSADSFPERNDRPLIIHEQIDVFNEEHTEFLLFALGGQPVRTEFIRDNRLVSIDPVRSPCDLDPAAQVCVPFRADCNPRTCSDPGRTCLEESIIQPLLDAGFDLWLVDHLRGQEDLTHIAAAAPLLYQQILNYGTEGDTLSGLASPGRVQAATYRYDPNTRTAERALADFERHILVDIPPDVPPRPRSGDRRAIVAGYSLGGVIARLGLRMWELRDVLPTSALTDLNGEAIDLASSASVALEDARAKVALFVSMDAPHRGARIPVSLQAYVRRIDEVLESAPQLSASDKAQLTRATQELDAIPTRQSLQLQIDAARAADPLGCWDESPPEPRNECHVRPFNENVRSRTVDQVFSAFAQTWLTEASTFDPASRDGLPAEIPAIALANGEMGQRHDVSSDMVTKITFNVNNFDDRNHHIMDAARNTAAVQVAGSQWNNICQRLRSVRVGYYMEDMFTGSIISSGSILGNFENLWNNAKGFFSNLFGMKLREIRVSYPMRARFDNEGQPLPGTAFPTLVPTASSLLLDDNGAPSGQWRDALWQARSEYHTNFDDRMCRMILFYAEGALGDDGDGWPACTERSLRATCKDGGRYPGNLRVFGEPLLDPEQTPCDCRPDDAESYPGAPENRLDGVDNDCDGRIDELDVRQ